MRAIIVFAFLFLCVVVTNRAVASDDSFTAKGTLYVTYNNGVGKDADKELSARFVPERVVFSEGSSTPSRAVRHFNIDNPREPVEAILGKAEMNRLSKDILRVVAVSVTVVLHHHRRVLECDYPADYATLLSIKALQQARPVSRDVAPIGC